MAENQQQLRLDWGSDKITPSTGLSGFPFSK